VHAACGNAFLPLLCQNIVSCTSSVLVPRVVLDDVGLFREHLTHAEDYDLWLRIAKKYALYSLDLPLVLYREHGNKLSANVEKIDFYALYGIFSALDGENGIDHNFVYNQFYRHRAAYRFSLEDYEGFRRYVRCASVYGSVGAKMRLRMVASYAPSVVRGVRWLKKNIKKRKVDCER